MELLSFSSFQRDYFSQVHVNRTVLTPQSDVDNKLGSGICNPAFVMKTRGFVRIFRAPLVPTSAPAALKSCITRVDIFFSRLCHHKK